MAGRKRPTQRDARERLQAAQQREAAALAAVELASGKVARAKDKLAAALVTSQRTVQEAEQGVARARAALAAVSGVERAAMLLDESVARVRADVRTAKEDQETAKGCEGGCLLADAVEPTPPLGSRST